MRLSAIGLSGCEGRRREGSPALDLDCGAAACRWHAQARVGFRLYSADLRGDWGGICDDSGGVRFFDGQEAEAPVTSLVSPPDLTLALERIANLALEDGWPEEGWGVVDEATGIALDALGWVHWRCSSRFTGCKRAGVGPRSHFLSAGWVERDGSPRCPKHAYSVDPTRWTEEMRPR